MLTEFALRDRPVALIASDQRMPEMTGVEFLEQSRRHAPDAKLVLLTAYADTDVAIKAINDIGLDYYLLKPWDPPEERLYPGPRRPAERLAGGAPRRRRRDCASSGTAGRSGATRSRRSSRAITCRTAGSISSATTKRAGCTTSRTRAPTTFRSCSFPTARRCGRRRRSISPTRSVCARAPSNRSTTCASSAAVPPVSRRRCTARPRGCRPSSSSARRRAGKRARARRSRTTSGSRRASPAPTSRTAPSRRRAASAPRWCSPATSSGFETRGPVRAVCFGDGSEIEARAVLVATGVSYRLLEAPGLDELAGRGVYYGATASEARACEGDDVYVVGAANSAGQAVLNLARYARRVVLLVRSDALEKSMSQYLVERIRAARQRRGAAPDRGRRRAAATITSRRSRSPIAPPGTEEEVADELALRVHRRVAAHRLARRRRRARRARASSSPATIC